MPRKGWCVHLLLVGLPEASGWSSWEIGCWTRWASRSLSYAHLKDGVGVLAGDVPKPLKPKYSDEVLVASFSVVYESDFLPFIQWSHSFLWIFNAVRKEVDESLPKSYSDFGNPKSLYGVWDSNVITMIMMLLGREEVGVCFFVCFFKAKPKQNTYLGSIMAL